MLAMLLLAAAAPQAAAAAAPAPSPASAGEHRAAPGLFDDVFGTMGEKPDASADARASRDDLNLVTVKAGQFTLGETLSLYQGPQGWCAPAGALLDTLGVEHDVTSGQLNVTLYEPRRHHEILTTELQKSPEGDCLLLADAAVLAEAKLDYDPANLVLNVGGDAPVPAALRAEREESRATRMGRYDDVAPKYPRLANPWRWLAMPTVDVALTGGWAGDRFAGSTIIEGAGDFAKATGRWRISASSTGAPHISGKFERVDADGGMLGALHARRIEVGDIAMPAQPLVGSALAGRGLLISDAPEWRADLFDQLVISGPLPLGWQAELSLGGRLLAFAGKPDANGEYRFEGVQLKVGANRFVVDLYGPHGEHVRRTVDRQVGSEQNPENEVTVTAGLVLPGVKASNLPTASPPAAIGATMARGLSDWATARLDVRHAIAGPAQAMGVSFEGSVLGGVAGISLAHRQPGGLAANAIFGRRLGGFNLTARYADFGTVAAAWASPEEASTARAVSADLSASFGMFGSQVGLAVGAQKTVDRAGVGHTGLKAQTSLRARRLKFDNQLATEFGAGGRALGTAALDWSLDHAHLRAQIGYALSDRPLVNQFAASFDTTVHGWSLQASANYDLNGHAAQFGGGVARRLGPFDVSVDVGWGKQGPQLAAGLRFAFGRVKGRGLALLPSGASHSATIAPNVVGPAGDPVKGGRFLVANSLRTELTGNDGTAIIGGIATARPATLALQLSSLEDDRLRPDRAGVEIAARPGQIIGVPIGLAPTGSIEVRLIRHAGDRVEPLVGVIVALIGADGQIFRATSDFDGYAAFEALSFGSYRAEATFGGTSSATSLHIDAATRDAAQELVL